MAPTACSTSAAFFWTCCTNTSNSPTACARATGRRQLLRDSSTQPHILQLSWWREEISFSVGAALAPLQWLFKRLADGRLL